MIRADGSIERGGQNLPGNWEAKDFNLPQRLREALPTIGDHDTVVLMHNDAVVQGLSELPWMQDVKHWAVMIFTNPFLPCSLQQQQRRP